MQKCFFLCCILLKAADKLTINWQNFAQVGLQLEFAFRIRLLRVQLLTIKFSIAYFIPLLSRFWIWL